MAKSDKKSRERIRSFVESRGFRAFIFVVLAEDINFAS